MDPVTLASTITAILTPYLSKIGENFAEDIGKNLWSVIAEKFKDRPTVAKTASRLASNANDPDNIVAFISLLKETLQEDRDFAKEMIDLLNQARSISNTGSGVVKSYGDITLGDLSVSGDVSGNIVIGHEDSIHASLEAGIKAGKRQKGKNK